MNQPTHDIDDAKTLLGFIPGGLDAVFPHAKVCDYVITERRGSYTRHPVGYLYLGGLPGSISHKPATCLYASPADHVVAVVSPACTNGALGSFQVIRSDYWKKRGRMLVLARDSHHIASPWVCTVPYLNDKEIEKWISSKT